MLLISCKPRTNYSVNLSAELVRVVLFRPADVGKLAVSTGSNRVFRHPGTGRLLYRVFCFGVYRFYVRNVIISVSLKK